MPADRRGVGRQCLFVSALELAAADKELHHFSAAHVVRGAGMEAGATAPGTRLDAPVRI